MFVFGVFTCSWIVLSRLVRTVMIERERGERDRSGTGCPVFHLAWMTYTKLLSLSLSLSTRFLEDFFCFILVVVLLVASISVCFWVAHFRGYSLHFICLSHSLHQPPRTSWPWWSLWRRFCDTDSVCQTKELSFCLSVFSTLFYR